VFVRGAHAQEPSGARIADTPGLGGLRANARCRQLCLPGAVAAAVGLRG
jgi:hypothetical protein